MLKFIFYFVLLVFKVLQLLFLFALYFSFVCIFVVGVSVESFEQFVAILVYGRFVSLLFFFELLLECEIKWPDVRIVWIDHCTVVALHTFVIQI